MNNHSFPSLYTQAMDYHEKKVADRITKVVSHLAGTGICITGELDYILTECTIDTDNARQVSRAAWVLGQLGYSFCSSGAGETIFTVDR
jgi:hypothetical protein